MEKRINNILREDLLEIIEDKKLNWNSLRDCTILVSGATGLIGSLIVKTLIFLNEQNCLNIKIVALIRNNEKIKEVYNNDELNNDYLHFICQDINNGFICDDKIDYIIHCASITNSKMMISNPVETILTSVNGTKNMLECAKKNNVKQFIYLSSMEIYGVVNSNSKIDEEQIGYLDLFNVRSSYPESKRLCELLCFSYYKQYEVPIRIARLSQTFGAGVNYEDKRIFAQLAKSIINNENFVMHTTGDSMGNYCYTSDMIRALFYILFHGKNGEVYNVVNEKNTMTIKEMVELIVAKFKSETQIIYRIPEFNIHGYGAKTDLRLSSSKLNEIGWEAKYNLDDMYKRLIKYWKSEFIDK